MTDKPPNDTNTTPSLNIDPEKMSLSDITSACLDAAHKAKQDARQTFAELTALAKKIGEDKRPK